MKKLSLKQKKLALTGVVIETASSMFDDLLIALAGTQDLECFFLDMEETPQIPITQLANDLCETQDKAKSYLRRMLNNIDEGDEEYIDNTLKLYGLGSLVDGKL